MRSVASSSLCVEILPTANAICNFFHEAMFGAILVVHLVVSLLFRAMKTFAAICSLRGGS